MSRTANQVLRGYIVPGMPQPLLCPDLNPAYASIRAHLETIRREIASSQAELLLLYSTQWLSVIGHQIQAHPRARWRHVDPDWHDLGDMPYEFTFDAAFGEAYQRAAARRGLHARTVAYDGFPIDTGSVVALSLLNPDNRIPASIVSCNMYADRAETLVLGKAAQDALQQSGRKAVAIAVTALSNRWFTEPIEPHEDRISSLKDDEWNRKLLEILGEGRLEDVAQLARSFTAQANADQKLKAIWWLAALMGQHNDYEGEVLDYQPIWGTGAAVARLVPSTAAASNLEFDEEDVEVYGGDRGVLETTGSDAPAAAAPAQPPVTATSANREPQGTVLTDSAPRPVGAYPHARRVGDLLYLSGVGPRQPGNDAIPGGAIRDAQGRPQVYDVAEQTRAVIENVRRILEAAGSSLQHIRDVTVFLVDMQRDFDAFNRVYADSLGGFGATRTTVEVRALPTPIAVEFKVIAAVDNTP
jgi:2-aminophenol/2-amino-5-chlorophenol 1,6-dioxygenase alpha subunit